MAKQKNSAFEQKLTKLFLLDGSLWKKTKKLLQHKYI